jgi:hypothetical protein
MKSARISPDRSSGGPLDMKNGYKVRVYQRCRGNGAICSGTVVQRVDPSFTLATESADQAANWIRTNVLRSVYRAVGFTKSARGSVIRSRYVLLPLASTAHLFASFSILLPNSRASFAGRSRSGIAFRYASREVDGAGGLRCGPSCSLAG